MTTVRRSIYTLAEARQYLKEAQEARSKALLAQSYGSGSHSLARASLAEINKDIRFWEDVVASLSGQGKFKRAVVKD